MQRKIGRKSKNKGSAMEIMTRKKWILALLIFLLVILVFSIGAAIYHLIEIFRIQMNGESMINELKDLDDDLNKSIETLLTARDFDSSLENLYLKEPAMFFKKISDKIGSNQKIQISDIDHTKIELLLSKCKSDSSQLCKGKPTSINSADVVESIKKLRTLGLALANYIRTIFDEPEKTWNLQARKEVEKRGTLSKANRLAHLSRIIEILRFFSKLIKEKQIIQKEILIEQRKKWDRTKLMSTIPIIMFSITAIGCFILFLVSKYLIEFRKVGKKFYLVLKFVQLAIEIISFILMLIIIILMLCKVAIFPCDLKTDLEIYQETSENIWVTFDGQNIDARKITEVCKKTNNKVLEGMNMMIETDQVISQFRQYRATIEILIKNITIPPSQNVWNEFETYLMKLKIHQDLMKKVENSTCIRQTTKALLKPYFEELNNFIRTEDEMLKNVKEILGRWKNVETNVKSELMLSGERMENSCLDVSSSFNKNVKNVDIKCSKLTLSSNFCAKSMTLISKSPIYLLMLSIFHIILMVYSYFLLKPPGSTTRKVPIIKKKEVVQVQQEKISEKRRHLRFVGADGLKKRVLITPDDLRRQDEYKELMKNEEKCVERRIRNMKVGKKGIFKYEYNCEDFEIDNKNRKNEEDIVIENVKYIPEDDMVFLVDSDNDEFEEEEEKMEESE